MKVIKEIKVLKISKPSEKEKNSEVKNLVIFTETTTDSDSIEITEKITAKSYVELAQNQVGKLIKFEADVSSYYLNGKSGLSIKLKKIV